MKRLLVPISLSLLLIGVVVETYFFYSISSAYTFWGDRIIKMDVTGEIGEFIGGVVGTLFALSGTLLIYLTFREQNAQNKREAFESAFFEMIRLHRENVSELKYSKSNGVELITSENRKVFKIIFSEFFECFHEVSKFYRGVDNILTEVYQAQLRSITERINAEIELKEMAMIDIAYSIVFFGIIMEDISFV